MVLNPLGETPLFAKGQLSLSENTDIEITDHYSSELQL